LREVSVREFSGAVRRLHADVLAMSGGWSPTVHLFKQAGGVLRWDNERVALRPDGVVQAAISVGAANGEFELANAVADAAAGVNAALAKLGRAPGAPEPPRARAPSGRVEPLWRVKARGKAFVDFQNDVTASDIELAEREGFRSVEHLKRYTTLGMAPDQGKTSNVNALAIMSELTHKTIAEVGTTGYRFPFTPTALGVFGGYDRGAIFRPARRMPAHQNHVAAGAVFEEYGGWLRPAYYPLTGEAAHQAEQREALAVRTTAGLFEGSPLGKIEVKGPDAGEFLDRIYANTMSTLKVGKLRYGLMLNELGVAIDDGVCARLGDDRFLVGSTGAGGDRIAAWLEEWLQCEWLDLNVIVAPVTTALAVLTVTGPKAREILQAVGVDFDVSAAALPHMTFREGAVGGLWARVCRVSFTGEASFEVNVAASDAPKLWEKFLRIGAPYGLIPVGIDAWMLLRTEKGFLHIGADTDGTTSALDVGWGHVLKRKHDFIGRRSLTRPADQDADRFQFVGLEGVDDARVLPIGAHVRTSSGSGASDGYVTSSGFSPVLKRGVALGMVRSGRARVGEILQLHVPEGVRRVRVIKPCVYDTEGVRIHA
jgi:sarcosine oxidase subunit alpha